VCEDTLNPIKQIIIYQIIGSIYNIRQKKNPQSKWESQQQTQPACDIESSNGYVMTLLTIHQNQKSNTMTGKTMLRLVKIQSLRKLGVI
jgi:hypothetical protein